MIENIIKEYATSGIEPKFHKPFSSKTKLNLDKNIKHLSEIEYMVSEALTKMGILYFGGIKEVTNLKIFDNYSYEQLKKRHKAESDWAFALCGGLLSKVVYGKWYNLFIKENPLSIVFLATIHEIGHVVYDHLDKIRNKELEEAFVISFHLYGLETFNTLNYGARYIIEPQKEDIKKGNNNELGIKTLKGLVNQFPTMKGLYLFLKDSTEYEILKKAGLKEF